MHKPALLLVWSLFAACDNSRNPGTPAVAADGVRHYSVFSSAGEVTNAAGVVDIHASTGANALAPAATHPRPLVHVPNSRSASVSVIDPAIVQAGHASLLTGGRADGSRLASPGEHRGGTIVGGTVRPIGPGDFFVVPAGVPHQYQIARGDSRRYLTIKVHVTGGSSSR